MHSLNTLQIARKRAGLKYGLLVHVIVYIVVNLFLLAGKIGTGIGDEGLDWPLLGWGVGVLLHAVHVIANTGRYSVREWLIQRELRHLSHDQSGRDAK